MNIFQLKLLAMIFMVLDHIHLFFPNTPKIFDYLGVLAIPLFVFALVEGIRHTSNLKRYFLRLYIFSIIMQGNSILLQNRPDVLWLPIGNSIRIFVVTFILIVLLEKYKTDNWLKNKGLWLFIGYQLLAYVISTSSIILLDVDDDMICFLNTVFATEGAVDGGCFFVLMGLIFYYGYRDYKKIALYLTTFIPVNMLVFNTPVLRMIGDKLSVINLDYSFYSFFQAVIGWDILFYRTGILENTMWMSIFVLAVIYFYDGKVYKSNRFQKYLFYVFYPAHLWLLYFLAYQL